MAENHTLKRALTDPHLFSGIGNAYSDEILHRARLSPLAMTEKLTPRGRAAVRGDPRDARRLDRAPAHALRRRLPREGHRVPAGDGGARQVRQPCPVCGTAVQRIRYADNETNYCPRCQTEGKLLADRGLSRLLKRDWPRTIDELERLRR